jgi:hypothetical protein
MPGGRRRFFKKRLPEKVPQTPQNQPVERPRWARFEQIYGNYWTPPPRHLARLIFLIFNKYFLINNFIILILIKKMKTYKK